jgi:hypothetical protein
MWSLLFCKFLLINGVIASNYSWDMSQDKTQQCNAYSGVCKSTMSFSSMFSQFCDSADKIKDDQPHMHPQCMIGFTRPHQKITCAQTRTSSCVVRGLSERPSLWKVWSSRGGEDVSDSSLLLARSLVSGTDTSCSNKARTEPPSNSADIIFLGDSVMSQMAQFFICDLLRAGARGRGSLAVASFNHTFAELTLPLSPHTSSHSPPARASDDTIVRIHNKQFNIPCIHSGGVGHCADPKGSVSEVMVATGHSPHKEDITRNFVFSLLKNYSSPKVLRCTDDGSVECGDTSFSLDGPLYIVFNYGLHIHIRNRGWALRGMARALLDFAKSVHNSGAAHKVHLLVRETTSQSFWFSPGID